MCPDINMNALASLLSLAIAHPELGKGKCLRVWHFYWISARFFASWARADVYTHITNRSPAPHFNEPSGFVEENMRGRLWENTLRWWELPGEAQFIAGLSIYWCCDRIPDRGTWQVFSERSSQWNENARAIRGQFWQIEYDAQLTVDPENGELRLTPGPSLSPRLIREMAPPSDTEREEREPVAGKIWRHRMMGHETWRPGHQLEISI